MPNPNLVVRYKTHWNMVFLCVDREAGDPSAPVMLLLHGFPAHRI